MYPLIDIACDVRVSYVRQHIIYYYLLTLTCLLSLRLQYYIGSSQMGIFSRVTQDRVYTQHYVGRRISLNDVADSAYSIAGQTIKDIAMILKLPVSSRRIVNLPNSVEGYAAVAAGIVGHAVPASASFLAMPRPRDEVNRMIYHAVRNIFVLKEFPTEKTFPITRCLCDYSKSTGVYLPPSYIEACSVLYAESAKSEDTAKEHVKPILNWTQD